MVMHGDVTTRAFGQVRARLYEFDRPAGRWRDVGTGPLRVNVAGAGAPPGARIILRRENHPHGAGTKLLLNAAVRRWRRRGSARACARTCVCV
jgi:hypothetical protein